MDVIADKIVARIDFNSFRLLFALSALLLYAVSLSLPGFRLGGESVSCIFLSNAATSAFRAFNSSYFFHTPPTVSCKIGTSRS